ALLDMVHVVEGDRTQFAPVAGQILGRMTDDVVPPPLAYAFDLPAVPSGTFVDVDNDGEADQGVQVFKLVVGSNITGGSYLAQLDQRADLNSFLVDPITGNITHGSVLVYAADDQQGFPSGFGDDGVLFTEDDPVVGLPQGYTVVHFGPDGFTYDRANDAVLPVLENPSSTVIDISDQGLLEGFNTLIDLMSVRYGFTELRNLDWEAIRAEWLPQFEQIEQLGAQDPQTALVGYGVTLHRLAQSIRDAHVSAHISSDLPLQIFNAILNAQSAPISTNVGANTVELDDGRIVVTDVAEGSPAADAGLTFGTEIVSLNGMPVADMLSGVTYNRVTGTAEGQRLQQVNNVLRFPPDSEPVTVEAILPGTDTAQSFTLTPGAYALPDRLASVNLRGDMPIEYDFPLPSIGYLNWDGFREPDVRIAVLEDFLRAVMTHPVPVDGIVLDMRGNGGGWDNLYFTMASYFFNEENPVSMHWIDQDVFDEASNGLVRQAPVEYLLSAPKPELYYDGPIVILTDQNCASSCEFFSQFLQTNGRATVVAQYHTAGAGAPIN
ncbi:MAG: S41 family peptidase, partial [Chloroflexota bacterium]